MNQKYGSGYFVLAQIAGSGKYTVLDYDNPGTTESLALPINGSLEYLCNTTNRDTIYINDICKRNTWSEKTNYVRTCGNGWPLMQFSNMNICDEFDAFIFYKEVSPLKLLYNEE